MIWVGIVGGVAVWTWWSFLRELDSFEEVVPTGAVPALRPFVSVVVPMRNEETNASRCLHSLLGQSYPDLEVIAVDDGSTDQTSHILDRFLEKAELLRVLRVGRKPEGWNGKSYALNRASRIARGSWLLFLDADTKAEPELVCSLVNRVAKSPCDMISLCPRQVLDSFWERAIQPVVFLIIMRSFSARKANDPTSKTAAANGQCIFINRQVYEQIGGHKAIKGSILDDFSLAGLVKERGFRLCFADGRKLIRTRMYKNLKDICLGWRKNLFVGADRNWGNVFFFTLQALLLAALVPTALVSASFLAGHSIGQVPLSTFNYAALTAALLISGVVIARIGSYFKLAIYNVPAISIGGLVAIGIMFFSAISRSVGWKGRVYSQEPINVARTRS